MRALILQATWGYFSEGADNSILNKTLSRILNFAGFGSEKRFSDTSEFSSLQRDILDLSSLESGISFKIHALIKVTFYFYFLIVIF